MILPDRQSEVLGRLAAAAKKRGLLIAPVGSVYFITRGGQTVETKDIDTVIHDGNLEIPPLQTIVSLGKDLGDVDAAEDQAVVKVYVDGPKGGPDTVELELLRGKRNSSDGFLPRKLLVEAARHAARAGNVLTYPPEFVVMLKADAAIDRAERARKDPPARAERNRRRAEAFRADVFRETQAMLAAGKVNEKNLKSALALLKANRRNAVAELLVAASGGRLRLD